MPSNVLLGIGIVEKVRDIETETKREQTTDTSVFIRED